jgi:hypothetical protein
VLFFYFLPDTTREKSVIAMWNCLQVRSLHEAAAWLEQRRACAAAAERRRERSAQRRGAPARVPAPAPTRRLPPQRPHRARPPSPLTLARPSLDTSQISRAYRIDTSISRWLFYSIKCSKFYWCSNRSWFRNWFCMDYVLISTDIRNTALCSWFIQEYTSVGHVFSNIILYAWSMKFRN